LAQDLKRTEASGAKECKVCGAEFECKGPGCWCTTVVVNPGQREHVAAVAADCVCPDCLTGKGRAKPLP
jgi:hypothetical protein